MLHPLIEEHLTGDDDPNLWDVAATTLLAEAGATAADTREEVYAQFGCCHHWISPHHPIRWAADGGFAWPFGYDKTTSGWFYRALPELAWSEFLRWFEWQARSVAQRNPVSVTDTTLPWTSLWAVPLLMNSLMIRSASNR